MNFLLILLIIIVGILIIELIKHKFSRSIFKFSIAIAIVIIILLILSVYIDVGEYIGKGSTFSNTGAVIIDGVIETTENVDKTNIFTSISDKSKELFNQIIDN